MKLKQWVTVLLIGLVWHTFTLASETQTLIEQGRFQNRPIDLVADFVPGDPDKPAVLILHGFLTSKDFPTVQAMRQTAESHGLAVLTPNLSYGYPLRKGPLKCNSLHRHRLRDDMAELTFWLNWLKKQGYREVILAGHSSASALLVHYLNRRPDLPVKVRGLILTSLFYLAGPEVGTRPAELEAARKAVQAGDRHPRKWHHQFCNGNYLATAESYLSYQTQLTRPKLLSALKAVATRWPTYIIMGGADARYRKTGRDLLTAYRQSGARLTVIDEANHFFSQEHEFDLQDRIDEILNELTS